MPLASNVLPPATPAPLLSRWLCMAAAAAPPLPPIRLLARTAAAAAAAAIGSTRVSSWACSSARSAAMACSNCGEGCRGTPPALPPWTPSGQAGTLCWAVAAPGATGSEVEGRCGSAAGRLARPVTAGLGTPALLPADGSLVNPLSRPCPPAGSGSTVVAARAWPAGAPRPGSSSRRPPPGVLRPELREDRGRGPLGEEERVAGSEAAGAGGPDT
ncbi:hypothetical protein V8C86DRAFT_2591352 [Haematococcus lacustris]